MKNAQKIFIITVIIIAAAAGITFLTIKKEKSPAPSSTSNVVKNTPAGKEVSPSKENNLPEKSTEQFLLYATKAGKEVKVWKEKINTRQKTTLLTYQEPKEAKKSGNYWESLGPNITLASDSKTLFYVQDDANNIEEGIYSFNLKTQTTEKIIFKTLKSSDEHAAPSWSFEKENEKRNVYLLAQPKVSSDQKYLSFAMGLYEGLSPAVINLDTKEFWEVQIQSGLKIGSYDLSWSKNNKLVAANSQLPGVIPVGLFVTTDEKFSQASNLTSQISKEEIFVHHPSWSPDSSQITFSYERVPSLTVKKENPKIGIINYDGSGFREIVGDGNSNDFPLFVNDKMIYYYKDSGDDLKDGIWQVQNDGMEQKQIIASSPNENLEPIKVESSLLVLLTTLKNTSEDNPFQNQLKIFDVEKKNFVYEDESTEDFITFLGLIKE